MGSEEWIRVKRSSYLGRHYRIIAVGMLIGLGGVGGRIFLHVTQGHDEAGPFLGNAAIIMGLVICVCHFSCIYFSNLKNVAGFKDEWGRDGVETILGSGMNIRQGEGYWVKNEGFASTVECLFCASVEGVEDMPEHDAAKWEEVRQKLKEGGHNTAAKTVRRRK